ncbi:NAD kinase 2, mitochondrial-like [Dysidea avara]|uniref:NAD kinase 2, mitochondrial-like n=1 Tax=Dysidea avara TaxID=196820 RepID=UPI00332265CB
MITRKACLNGVQWREILRHRRQYGEFNAARVTLVQKVSRYDFEKSMHSDLPEQDLKKMLVSRGSDLASLLARRDRHQICVREILEYLRQRGTEVRVRDVDSYEVEDVEWADVVLSVGGDGTFLRTSSKLMSTDTPLVGLNSDPERSEGLLCASWPHTNYSSQSEVLDKLFTGKFKWKLRHRIRVQVGRHHLPVLVLNEVFIGEQDAHHTSYYEITCDSDVSEKQKSSGLVIYTGTGSTAWVYNINRMGDAKVQQLLQIVKEKSSSIHISPDLVNKVMTKFNQSVVYNGSQPTMSYAVREPITRGIFSATHTQGTAKQITVKSRGWEPGLFIDGWYHCKFPEGTVAKFEMRLNDALRTVELI